MLTRPRSDAAGLPDPIAGGRYYAALIEGSKSAILPTIALDAAGNEIARTG